MKPASNHLEVVSQDHDAKSKEDEIEAIINIFDHKHNPPSVFDEALAQSQGWCAFEQRSKCTVFIQPSALQHHPLYSISRDKYCGKLRGSVRQDWNTLDHDDDQQKMWEELKVRIYMFIDSILPSIYCFNVYTVYISECGTSGHHLF